MATAQPEPDPKEEPTIGRLIADSTADISSLIRDEIALAKTELRFSVKAGGIGAALFAVAGFLAVLAVIMLSIAFAYFLDWWIVGTATAFIIVFGVYLLITVVLALIGRKKIKQVKAPEQTIAAVKSNKQVLKRG
ncbi:MAG: phage holin family protein [Nocardioidaceae bacterium]|nr:phage holin family protein [Nocardioidaceae bacterium]